MGAVEIRMENMDSAGCPDRAELFEFAVGMLPEPAMGRLARHLEGCAKCETRLEGLDETADLLVSRLREPSGGQTAATVPDHLIQAARALMGAAGHGAGPALPRRVGKFELIEELGIGSFGYVFRARDTELDRPVAIKILRAGRLASDEDVDRFLREARSAAQLKHPGIVSLYDTGQADDGTWYLVEELVQGSTLARRLSKGPLGARQAAELLVDMAEALDYAHQKGVIHRDLKPSNIVLDDQGRPHLTDFGLAKREAEEPPATPEGQVLGTPAYMSPEQARGDSHLVDARSDLYSLGVVLYEMLTGERPFRGNRRMLILQVLEDEPRAPRRLNDKIPRDLETVCLKAMAKAPARRYASGLELADDLRRWLAGEPIKARPMGRPRRVWHWCRRNPVPSSLLLAVTLGSVVGLWHLSRLSEKLVQSTALESAMQESEMLAIVNEDYAKIVERLNVHKIEVTHDYAHKQGAIPLPATLTIDLGRHISERSASGMQVRLYSAYPFKTRRDGGPRDGFERMALEALSRNPDAPFWRFEDYQERASLRYATARRMDETCVRCHNNHPDSTKKDWKVGDVPGVLEIIRPLDRDIRRARQGLRGSFVLMISVGASLSLVSVLVLVAGKWRRQRMASC